MTHRVSIGFLLCTISLLTAQAQWNKQDSIRLQQLLKGEGDLKINTEAVKSIHFDFTPTKEQLQGKPMMSQDKPWMKFRNDLPKNFGDTTQWVKPTYTRATPYTPYTKYNEDPVNDPIVKGEKEWKMNIPFNFGRSSQKYDPREERVMPPSKNNNAMQVGAGIAHIFDADKLLYENLTTRGRAIKRNRRLAKAWKTYKDYQPTRKDSILLNLIQGDSIKAIRDSLLLEYEINSQNKAKKSGKVVPAKFHFKRPD